MILEKSSGLKSLFHHSEFMWSLFSTEPLETMFLMLVVKTKNKTSHFTNTQHTHPPRHYFSCVLLYIFLQSKQTLIMEQITRVLLERLIVHRPHPWGLLITFIELIKNPRYGFWKQSFTRCAPEIERLFQVLF